MGINIDDLMNNQTEDTNETGVMDLAVTPKTKTKVKGETKETGTNNIYDQLKTLMYMVDISGSMLNPIKASSVTEYEWPENLKDYIKRQLAFTDVGELTEKEKELSDMLDSATDAEIKVAVINQGPKFYGIYSKPSQRGSKMDLVKKCIADLVDRRYEKFPDARVVLGTFNNEATIEAADKVTIKMKLSQLIPNGGTSIYNAVSQALGYFKQYPSPVGLNHLIIVSDGEDWNAIQIKEDLFEQMKEQGVSLDYIYIKGETYDAQDTVSAVAKMFVELCKELGGEYTEVNSANEFEKKLIQASTRLCLPPGA